MSADVQPRKRKDKKRKKEDSTEQLLSQVHSSLKDLNEDVNIHVHKEDGTGGGICAKIVFFLLFSALAVVIGLIITEHRGLTNLDTIDTESRFAQIFEGWTDKAPEVHDDDHLEHLEHSLEQDDHDEDVSHGDHDENEVNEENEDDELEKSDELDDNDRDEEEDEDTKSMVESEEEDDDENDDDENDKEDSELKDSEEDEGDDENTDEQDQTNEDEIDDDVDDDEVQMISKELTNSREQEEDDDIDQANEADDVDDEGKDVGKIDANENEQTVEDQENQNSSRVGVKIGVGFALLVVAYVVLVRKRKSVSTECTKEDELIVPDLTRRNTIVVPPAFQEVKQDIEETVDEDDESDEDGEVDSDTDARTPLRSAKMKYQELRQTYSRSLTPDSEPDQDKSGGDYEGEGYEEEEEDEEEDEEDDVDYVKDDDEDEELLKRLEVKYGKLHGKQADDKEDYDDEQLSSWKHVNIGTGESDSDQQSDDEVEPYKYANITNKEDEKIKEKLDEAQKTIQHNAAYAIKLFDVLLQKYPSSPRCLYGKAQALDLLADQKRSNEILQQAISTYIQLLNTQDISDALFEAAADRCINRMRFIGHYSNAIKVHNMLISHFPNEPRYRNQLAVTYLTTNKINNARSVLKETLSKYPNNGFALVHYGFILKTSDNNLNESIAYLSRGINTKEPGVIDGRFYFHLGDALTRLGKSEEAMKVYEEAVDFKLFLSKYQRSLYNVKRLKGKPWWSEKDLHDSSLHVVLEDNWIKIRNEGLAILNRQGHFQSESESLKDTGDWRQFELFARGQKNVENCKKCPTTCGIIDAIPDARGCKRGQTKFSVMHPGTHVWPHCGPTNCRLRVHLGLKVPTNTFIRVANETRSWVEGRVFVFDDSFEHEVWHNGTELRLVLIVDIWHPELTSADKRSLSPI